MPRKSKRTWPSGAPFERVDHGVGVILDTVTDDAEISQRRDLALDRRHPGGERLSEGGIVGIITDEKYTD
jgi:hypothetical protein